MEDGYFIMCVELFDCLDVLFGGCVVEELIFGDVLIGV